MNARIARQIRRIRDSDESGLSMIEVIVAMMVFAIIATGIAYTILTTLHTSKDGKGREVALNLASQAIDAARSVTDIFALQGSSTTVTVPGDSTAYTIQTSVDWVTSTGSDADCGSGGGTLLYKEVNVTVTWAGMTASNPVRADTIVAPSSTINDPSLGTILVSVKNAAGNGVPGVAISVSPSTGTTPPVTDAQGCSYILKVAPGAYSVSATKAGYIDYQQDTTPTKPSLGVVAGGTSPASFSFDLAGSVQVKYASNYAPTTRPNLPSNLTTTFSSTLGGQDSVPSSAGTLSGTTGTYPLFPFGAYTSVVSGTILPTTTTSTGCPNVDPTTWPATSTKTSPPSPTASFGPGQSATVNVPMGVVTINTGGSSGMYITATAAASSPVGSGDPGCFATPLATYTFGPLNPTSGNLLIALPYGSYTLKSGTSTTPSTTVTASKMTLAAGSIGLIGAATNVLTLDPRTATP